MGRSTVNFARFLRPKQFEYLVGQELPVKVLKNSLYLRRFFPVYLFAGQRGCGKTTTARIFACAINCQAYESFCLSPKGVVLPCLSCANCTAMITGKHPDFFEMDAASHTGVDTVRSLIEATSLLPVLGRKKIYLIDEAHMLSKAAFNALLKVLEEPPPCVLFILATTNQHKVIDTVRSRCFQLFFRPVATALLVNYLTEVCESENINATKQSLFSIAQYAQGSVRDALNLLEQVRFSAKQVTPRAVHCVLASMSDSDCVQLFENVLFLPAQELLRFFKTIGLGEYDGHRVWSRFFDVFRAVWWTRYGAEDEQFIACQSDIKRLSQVFPQELFSLLVEAFRLYDDLVARMSVASDTLAMVFLQINYKCQSIIPSSEGEAEEGNFLPIEKKNDTYKKEENNVEPKVSNASKRWDAFVRAIEQLSDPLVLSIFKQASFVRYEQDEKKVVISFSDQLLFFKQWIDDTRAVWTAHLHRLFGDSTVLSPLFILQSSKKNASEKNIAPSASLAHIDFKKTVAKEAKKKKKVILKEKSGVSAAKKIDVSDKRVWKKTALLMHYFPGKVIAVTTERTA